MICNIDAFAGMADLPDHSVNLICIDPPYGTTSIAWDKVLPFDRLWPEFERLLAPGGCCVIFGAMPFTAMLYASKPEWYRDHLVWDKNKCGSPGLAKKRPMRTHEDILIFSPHALGRFTYRPQMEAGEPYHRKSSNPDGYIGRENNHGYGLKPRTEFSNEGTRYPKSVRRVSRDFSAQQQVHPTQKPVPLMRWLVETYSNPGDTVLDICMGSGSTGLGCEGREFIGFELDPGYFAIAAERLA